VSASFIHIPIKVPGYAYRKTIFVEQIIRVRDAERERKSVSWSDLRIPDRQGILESVNPRRSPRATGNDDAGWSRRHPSIAGRRSTLSAQSGPTDFMSYKSAILREPSHIHVRAYAMHRQYVSATFCSGARTVPAESRRLSMYELPVLAHEHTYREKCIRLSRCRLT